MKKFFGVFVIGGLIVVGLAVFFINKQSEVNKKEFQRELAMAKQKTAEAETGLRTSGDAKEYVRDQNEVLKRYRAELDKLGKKNKNILDVDAEKRKFGEEDEKSKKPLSAD